MAPHPAKKSRITALLASIAVLVVQVQAMLINSHRVSAPTPSISAPSEKISPSPAPTVTKLKTVKKKVHAVSGATKKK